MCPTFKRELAPLHDSSWDQKSTSNVGESQNQRVPGENVLNSREAWQAAAGQLQELS